MNDTPAPIQARQSAVDLCLPFEIEGADVRGQAVRLHGSIDQVLKQHQYPAPVSVFVGEILALTVMLGVSLKFDGRLSLQTKSDGPVSMVVADFFAPGMVRAYARFDEDKVKAVTEAAKGERFSVPLLLGKGQFTMVIDQGADMELYQSIVSLEGDTVAECTRTCFQQSDQIATSFKVAVSEVFTSEGQSWSAGAIMIQHLPKPGEGKKESGDTPEEIWNRVNILMATTQDHELTDPSLSSEDLLFRLFNEDGVRAFEPSTIGPGCTCGEEKVRGVLNGFDPAERADMAVDGKIEVTCEFCNAVYGFDPDEFGV
jgi:molecular chaperone Hsp33